MANDKQTTNIKDSSVGDGSGAVSGNGSSNAVNADGATQVTGGSLTYNALDAATVKNALDSNTLLVAKVLDATAAFQDKSTAALASTVQSNNALSGGTLTTLRDALSSTLKAPQLAGDAANSGAGVTSWVKENPALAALIALGILLLIRSKS